MGKKPVVVIQMLIGLIFLIVSIGLIVFTVNQTVETVKYLRTEQKVDTSTPEKAQEAVGDILSKGIQGIVFGMGAVFGSVMSLLSLFMVLDAIYKWPSKQGNVNYSK